MYSTRVCQVPVLHGREAFAINSTHQTTNCKKTVCFGETRNVNGCFCELKGGPVGVSALSNIKLSTIITDYILILPNLGENIFHNYIIMPTQQRYSFKGVMKTVNNSPGSCNATCAMGSLVGW